MNEFSNFPLTLLWGRKGVSISELNFAYAEVILNKLEIVANKSEKLHEELNLFLSCVGHQEKVDFMNSPRLCQLLCELQVEGSRESVSHQIYHFLEAENIHLGVRSAGDGTYPSISGRRVTLIRNGIVMGSNKLLREIWSTVLLDTISYFAPIPKSELTSTPDESDESDESDEDFVFMENCFRTISDQSSIVDYFISSILYAINFRCIEGLNEGISSSSWVNRPGYTKVECSGIKVRENFINALLHESIHSFLYKLQTVNNIYLTDIYHCDETIQSPWTGKMLPLHSFIHANFVWAGLFFFWDSFSIEMNSKRASCFKDKASRGFISRDKNLDKVSKFLRSEYIPPSPTTTTASSGASNSTAQKTPGPPSLP